MKSIRRIFYHDDFYNDVRVHRNIVDTPCRLFRKSCFENMSHYSRAWSEGVCVSFSITQHLQSNEGNLNYSLVELFPLCQKDKKSGRAMKYSPTIP